METNSDKSGPAQRASLETLYRDFISACHIIHYHNVVDAFGHISFRHPSNPQVFVMSRNMAPGTVSVPSDLVEYHVADASPVKADAPPGFSERHIHSECYMRYPGIHSVLHNHAEAVVPYTFSGVPLRACCHMAGFLGSHVRVWDIADAYEPTDRKDLLVRNSHLGRSLADCFGDHASRAGLPQHSVTLMRNHGVTILGETMQECVMKAVYTVKNATLQSTALTIHAAEKASGPMVYLRDDELVPTAEIAKYHFQRPWDLWRREVEACNLYVNKA